MQQSREGYLSCNTTPCATCSCFFMLENIMISFNNPDHNAIKEELNNVVNASTIFPKIRHLFIAIDQYSKVYFLGCRQLCH